MSDFDENKLRRLDIGVLLIFLGLMRSGKASDVARDLGLTASAISHALTRLRSVFEDDLFLRRPHGMEPTAFARAIEPEIRDIVERLNATLSGPQTLNKATLTAHLRIACRDLELATFLPDVLTRLRVEAPGLTVSVTTATGEETSQGLKDGKIDLGLGFFPDADPNTIATHLTEESYLVAARRDHPALQATTLDAYLAADHLLVSSDGSRSGIVDTTLAAQGLSRRVAATIPYFLHALALLERSDLIATLPARLLQNQGDRFALSIAETPLTIRSFRIGTLIHKRDERNPLLKWVTEEIAAALKGSN